MNPQLGAQHSNPSEANPQSASRCDIPLYRNCFLLTADRQPPTSDAADPGPRSGTSIIASLLLSLHLQHQMMLSSLIGAESNAVSISVATIVSQDTQYRSLGRLSTTPMVGYWLTGPSGQRRQHLIGLEFLIMDLHLALEDCELIRQLLQARYRLRLTKKKRLRSGEDLSERERQQEKNPQQSQSGNFRKAAER